MAETELGTFDYVVVGAGSAGSVLAGRLSATGASVAVVEAGGPDRHPWVHIPVGYARILMNPKLSWCYRTAPDASTGNRAMDYPRGKVWGGSSSINGLGHVWGDPSDYDLWAQKGARGWSWADLHPYFLKQENFRQGGEERGHAGPQVVEHLVERPRLLDHFARAAAEIGLPVNEDMNGPLREGYATFQQTRRGRRRISAARAWLVPALKTGRVLLIDHALALGLTMHEGRVDGLRLRRGEHVQVVRARREVLLCAGAIGSPQLLMLSGFGPGPELQQHGITVRQDMPGIGRNLQDHYVTRLSFRLADHSWSANRRIVGWRQMREGLRWALRGDGILTWSPAMMSMFARTLPGLEAPDIQINGGPLSWQDGRIGTPEKEPGMSLGVWQCRPDSRGSVTLASADPAAAPIIAPRHLTADADCAAVVRGMRLARRWMAAPAMQGVVMGEVRPGPAADSDEALLDFARREGGTVYHPSCTVRMGADVDAPLDHELRLRGVAGLRVVDASVFPDIPVCNINATVLAVAEKAADMVLAAG